MHDLNSRFVLVVPSSFIMQGNGKYFKEVLTSFGLNSGDYTGINDQITLYTFELGKITGCLAYKQAKEHHVKRKLNLQYVYYSALEKFWKKHNTLETALPVYKFVDFLSFKLANKEATTDKLFKQERVGDKPAQFAPVTASVELFTDASALPKRIINDVMTITVKDSSIVVHCTELFNSQIDGLVLEKESKFTVSFENLTQIIIRPVENASGTKEHGNPIVYTLEDGMIKCRTVDFNHHEFESENLVFQ